MGWFDIHCHCDSASDAPAWSRRAQEAGVVGALSCATNREGIEAHLKNLSGPFWHLGLGIYPLEAAALSSDQLDDVGTLLLARADFFSAIGEVGLDFFRESELQSRQSQVVVFQRMIALAVSLDKPLVVHSRAAERETLDLLESAGARRVLLHWFSGSKQDLSRAMRLGYLISIGPAVYSSGQIQSLARHVDGSHLVLETDAPVRFNGQASEPAWIPRVGAEVARLRGEPIEQVAERTTANAHRLLGL